MDHRCNQPALYVQEYPLLARVTSFRYRWYSQGTNPSVRRLQNIYASDRPRMITARYDPIPNLVEIIPKIGFELRDGLFINLRPALVRPYTLSTLVARSQERLCVLQ